MHFRKCLCSLMIVAASLPTLSGLAQAPAGKKSSGEKWAILIGIDDYLNAGDLKYCGADQRSLKDQLIRSGFDERQVFLLDDEAKDRKLLPFKANVERQLQTVLGFAERGDFILLAFSGHGVHFNKVSYLCPIDAKLDDPSTLISMDWVYEQLGKSKADLRLVMVDACRNDPRPEGQRSMSPKELREGTRQFVETSDQRLPEGIVLLHSCSEGEVSQEDKDFGHGVFMHYVLEGLAGKADKDGDQIVSFNELVRYTSKETKLFVEKRYNDSQRPKLKGNLTGDVLDFGLSSLLNAPRQPQHDAPASEQRRSEFSNSLGMKLVPFKAGTFLMGDAKIPVTLSRDFSVGQTEVTQGQWKQVMGTEPWKGETLVKEGANYPATYVSWEDSMEFCRKLTEQERRASRLSSDQLYTLPTEAQWEYACRAGTKTEFSFGDDESKLGDYAWWAGNTQSEPYAHEVGLKKPNPAGLYDIHGNVWEWCMDWHHENLAGGRDPVGPTTGSFRVRRGGSWIVAPVSCRSANRYWDSPEFRFISLGFRVVLQSVR